jgi:hypothetical protein
MTPEGVRQDGCRGPTSDEGYDKRRAALARRLKASKDGE